MHTPVTAQWAWHVGMVTHQGVVSCPHRLGEYLHAQVSGDGGLALSVHLRVHGRVLETPVNVLLRQGMQTPIHELEMQQVYGLDKNLSSQLPHCR